MTRSQASTGALALLRAELQDSGLMDLLDDPTVTDVMVNPRTVFVATQDRGTFEAGLAIDSDRLENLIASLAGYHGLVVDREHPILEADLPIHASRAQAVLPPVSASPLLTLRKPAARFLTLGELVANQTLPDRAAALLREAVQHRETLLIAGGVGAGKTTLLRALLAEVLTTHPAERLVICEEGSRELSVGGANVVQLLASDEARVGLTRLVRCALRLNPDRILIGEARGPEALDFLRACNTGHPGGMLTLHANSALDAVYRLDDLIQEAGVPSQLPRIAASVSLLVFVRRSGDHRVLEEVQRIDGYSAERGIASNRLYSRTRAPGTS